MPSNVTICVFQQLELEKIFQQFPVYVLMALNLLPIIKLAQNQVRKGFPSHCNFIKENKDICICCSFAATYWFYVHDDGFKIIAC